MCSPGYPTNSPSWGGYTANVPPGSTCSCCLGCLILTVSLVTTHCHYLSMLLAPPLDRLWAPRSQELISILLLTHLTRTELTGSEEMEFVELMDLWGFLFGLSWKFMCGGDLEFSPRVWVPFSEGVSCFCTGISMSIYCKGEIFMTLRQKPGQRHRDGFIWTSLEVFVHLVLCEKLSKSSHWWIWVQLYFWRCFCVRNKIVYVHAKSLLLCLTLCDPINCSPPGSSVHGILQARVLEWVPKPFGWSFYSCW